MFDFGSMFSTLDIRTKQKYEEDFMAGFLKLTQNDITEGVCFSAPVFFDDGKNMFLAAGKPAKPYHLAALKTWNIPFLLTVGHVLKSMRRQMRISKTWTSLNPSTTIRR